MSYTLPDISSLSSLDTAAKLELLNHLFEQCHVLQDLLIPRVFNHYHSYSEFIEACRSFLLAFLGHSTQDAKIASIIAAHPRLGATQRLSSHSTNEQKSLSGTEHEAEKLKYYNDLYEKTFPGLRYVVFVNGRSREVIMQNMQQRIDRNNIDLEKIDAFNAMCDIAIDRANKLGAKL